MPRLRHTVELILAKLREAEVALSKGQSVAQVCRSYATTTEPRNPAPPVTATRLFEKKDVMMA